jgi:hypothetical protein
VESKPTTKKWGDLRRLPAKQSVPDTYEEMAKQGLLYTDSGEKVL